MAERPPGACLATDYLTVLDRRTGKALARAAVPSGPEWILLRRGKLFVRTYDHDLVLRVAGGGRVGS